MLHFHQWLAASSTSAVSRYSDFHDDLLSIATTFNSVSRSRSLMEGSLEMSTRESRLLQDALEENERLVSKLDDQQDVFKDALNDAKSLGRGKSSFDSNELSKMDEEAMKLAATHVNNSRIIVETAEEVGKRFF